MTATTLPPNAPNLTHGAPTALTDPATVVDVQRKLKEKGYSETGPVDGDAASQTTDAILAFRARNNLPLTPTIDKDFLIMLDAAGPKLVPIEQATATPAHVAEQVAVVKTNWWTKLWAKILAIPSGVLTILIAVVDNVGDASNKLMSVKSFLSDVPLWVWPGLVVAVSLLIYYTTHNVESGLVKGYQQGTVKEDLGSETVHPVTSGELVEVKTNG